MQFILLKCVIKWFFIYSQNCATLPLLNFGTFSSPQKEAHYPWQSLPILLSPQPLVSTNLLFISMDLPILNISFK